MLGITVSCPKANINAMTKKKLIKPTLEAIAICKFLVTGLYIIVPLTLIGFAVGQAIGKQIKPASFLSSYDIKIIHPLYRAAEIVEHLNWYLGATQLDRLYNKVFFDIYDSRDVFEQSMLGLRGAQYIPISASNRNGTLLTITILSPEKNQSPIIESRFLELIQTQKCLGNSCITDSPLVFEKHDSNSTIDSHLRNYDAIVYLYTLAFVYLSIFVHGIKWTFTKTVSSP